MKQLFTISLLILSTLGFGNATGSFIKLSLNKVRSIDKIKCTVNSSRIVSICQGETFFVEGSNQTKAGIYYDTLTTNGGCDSVITTTLTVTPTYYKQDTVYLCGYDSVLINGRYLKINGTYIDSFKTTQGCDSVIETTVINRVLFILVSPFGPSALVTDITNAKYQWLDCDDNYAPIDSNTNNTATKQLFRIPKPGRYAVEVTLDGCIDTSDCYDIVTAVSYTQLPSIKVYPNPAHEQVTIDLGEEYANTSIDIITITGQILQSINFKNQKVLTLNTQHLATGIYMLRINNGKKATMVRITIN
jgi:hypothetical protein